MIRNMESTSPRPDSVARRQQNPWHVPELLSPFPRLKRVMGNCPANHTGGYINTQAGKSVTSKVTEGMFITQMVYIYFF